MEDKMIHQHCFIVGREILELQSISVTPTICGTSWFWQILAVSMTRHSLNDLIYGLFIAQCSATVAGEYFHIAPDTFAGNISESPPVFGVVPSNPALACE